MKLNEILNKKVDYEVIKARGGTFQTEATIGGRVIVFSASEEMDNEWELSFGEKTAGKTAYGMTGSGSELEVLSMVKDSILEFVERYHPEKMYFTADKDSTDKQGNDKTTRARVYERMIKKFNVTGYTYSKKDDINTIRFTLSKA